MNRNCTNDTRQFIFTDKNSLSASGFLINSAHLGKFQCTVAFNISNNKAYLVHMCRDKKFRFCSLLALFESKDISERINL